MIEQLIIWGFYLFGIGLLIFFVWHAVYEAWRDEQ